MEVLQASSVQVTSSMSILKSANQQPKLALDVLQGSMPSASGPAGMQSAAAQQPANTVQSVSAGTASDGDADDRGGSIDIRV